jgi:hypothetical protein
MSQYPNNNKNISNLTNKKKLEASLEGHQVDLKLATYKIDGQNIDEFAVKFGFRGGDSPQNIKFMQKNDLPYWETRNDGIPELKTLYSQNLNGSFVVESPNNKSLEGHQVNLKLPIYYLDGQNISEFEANFGYRGGDSRQNIEWMKEKQLPHWKSGKAEIPGLDKLPDYDRELIETIIKCNALPNSILALEGYLISIGRLGMKANYQDIVVEKLDKLLPWTEKGLNDFLHTLKGLDIGDTLCTSIYDSIGKCMDKRITELDSQQQNIVAPSNNSKELISVKEEPDHADTNPLNDSGIFDKSEILEECKKLRGDGDEGVGSGPNSPRNSDGFNYIREIIGIVDDAAVDFI